MNHLGHFYSILMNFRQRAMLEIKHTFIVKDNLNVLQVFCCCFYLLQKYKEAIVKLPSWAVPAESVSCLVPFSSLPVRLHYVSENKHSVPPSCLKLKEWKSMPPFIPLQKHRNRHTIGQTMKVVCETCCFVFLGEFHHLN